MKQIAEIRLTFWEDVTVSTLMNVLLNSGWKFPESNIRYLYYEHAVDMPSTSTSVSIDEWERLSAELDVRQSDGFTIIIDSLQRNDDLECNVFIDSKKSFFMIFWNGGLILKECQRLSDYSKLLLFTAAPFIELDLNIEEIVCTHSYD